MPVIHEGQGRTLAHAAKVRAKMAADNLATAREVAEMAYRLCPVSDNNAPGHVHTRDTIQVVELAQASAMVEVGGAALWINYGTSRTPANPFWSMAIEMGRRFRRERGRQVVRL